MHRLVLVSAAVFLAMGTALGVSVIEAPEARSATPCPQTVDNSKAGCFWAYGWSIRSAPDNPNVYGDGYRIATTSQRDVKPASFKVGLSSAARYKVYVRWPASSRFNPATPVGIETTSGWRWRTVNQQRNGGQWMRIGGPTATYAMKAGDRIRVRISRNSQKPGYVVADAVRIAKATAPTSSGPTGMDVVREAKKYLDSPYTKHGYSPSVGFDCDGFVSYVYKEVTGYVPNTGKGVYLTHDGPDSLWNDPDGTKLSRSTLISSLKPGDIIYGRADGFSNNHVGIYDGDGHMIHAANPTDDVEVIPWPTFPGTSDEWFTVYGYKRIVR